MKIEDFDQNSCRSKNFITPPQIKSVNFRYQKHDRLKISLKVIWNWNAAVLMTLVPTHMAFGN
jgi:hypothetical protein